MKLKPKPIILVFIDWFWPGYLAGGPVQSILALTEHLHGQIEFKIVTTNSDIDKIPYSHIQTDRWIQSEKNCSVYYMSESALSKATIQKLMLETTYDKIYLNSFFSSYFSILPLKLSQSLKLKKPILLAPRGMLGSGALQLKWFKKSAFIKITKLLGWHKGIIWHATSNQEFNEIKAVFGEVSCHVISNLPKQFLASPESPEKKQGYLNMCFVSRISPKKNLEYALQILKEVKAAQVCFSIYGPIEDAAYWKLCQTIISDMPAHIKIAYMGSFSPSTITEVYKNQHVLLLPTMNENYGHAIVESLSMGCPVIISDQTPWNDMHLRSAGYSIPLSNKALFVEKIEELAALNQSDWEQRSKAAKQYISEKLNIEKIKAQYIQLFT